MRRAVIRAVLVVVAVAGLALGLLIWRDATVRRIDRENVEAAGQLAAGGDFSRARILARQIADPQFREATMESIRRKEQAAALTANDARKLQELTRASGTERLTEDEALLLARAAIHQRDFQEYEELVAQWASNPQRPAAWTLIEADALTIRGEPDAARELLAEASFSGANEANRNLRLATLAGDDRSTARRHVIAAVEADPTNAEALGFRGHLFEADGNFEQARADYVRAALVRPELPVVWDQLAEFYQRRQHYAFAIETWIDGFRETDVTEFWLKAWFWRRVSGLGPELPSTPEDGPLGGYAIYLANLPNGQWWDEAAFATLPYGSRILEFRQSSYWLRVVQALADGDSESAMTLIRQDPFSDRSWSQTLKRMLLRLDALRAGDLVPPADWPIDPEAHQFIALLAATVSLNSEVGSPLKALIASDAGWAAALLAIGWSSAAIALDDANGPPELAPDWYTYGQAQARRLAGDPDAALSRLRMTKPTSPLLNLLEAELLLATGQLPPAREALAAIETSDGDLALRRDLLLAQIYRAEGKFEELREMLDSPGTFAETLFAKELAAAIAVAEGDLKHAQELYAEIADESVSAKLFLARIAFQANDWERARELTEAMIAERPGETAFYENLRKINAAAAAAVP